jgi:hypothetical protein
MVARHDHLRVHRRRLRAGLPRPQRPEAALADVESRDTGTYTRSVLTEGQGGTFVEMEAGNDPKTFAVRAQVAVVGQRLFRRWVEHALERLREAAEARSPAENR